MFTYKIKATNTGLTEHFLRNFKKKKCQYWIGKERGKQRVRRRRKFEKKHNEGIKEDF